MDDTRASGGDTVGTESDGADPECDNRTSGGDTDGTGFGGGGDNGEPAAVARGREAAFRMTSRFFGGTGGGGFFIETF